MKNYGKTLLIIILICTTNPVFSQNSLEEIQVRTDKFTDVISKSLPFHSNIGNNWSDAYIGQTGEKHLRFGIGISAGFTNVEINAVKDILKCFNIILPFVEDEKFTNMGLFIPGYALDIRVGGFNLPLDFGLKVAYLPQTLTRNIIEEFEFDYRQLLFGMDIRYSFINYKLIPIKFSAGIGVNFMDGEIGKNLARSLTFSFIHENTDYILDPTHAHLNLQWRTLNSEIKAQISFPFRFLTPYAGAGISFAWTRTGYEVSTSDLTAKDLADKEIGLSDVTGTLENKYGMTGVYKSGFETIKTINSLSARAFGGFSINLIYVRLDVTAMYELFNGNFGGTIGLRFQY
jgi:hypothetical protein